MTLLVLWYLCHGIVRLKIFVFLKVHNSNLFKPVQSTHLTHLLAIEMSDSKPCCVLASLARNQYLPAALTPLPGAFSVCSSGLRLSSLLLIFPCGSGKDGPSPGLPPLFPSRMSRSVHRAFLAESIRPAPFLGGGLGSGARLAGAHWWDEKAF